MRFCSSSTVYPRILGSGMQSRRASETSVAVLSTDSLVPVQAKKVDNEASITDCFNTDYMRLSVVVNRQQTGWLPVHFSRIQTCQNDRVYAISAVQVLPLSGVGDHYWALRIPNPLAPGADIEPWLPKTGFEAGNGKVTGCDTGPAHDAPVNRPVRPDCFLK